MMKYFPGTKGAIKRHASATGSEIGDEGESYVAAINGNDLVLTIDMNVQSIIEKYLKEACIDNSCTDGGNVIAMNPQNGDILAMATYPSYNLNEPYSAYTDELKGIWDTQEQAEKTKSLQAVWKMFIFRLRTCISIILSLGTATAATHTATRHILTGISWAVSRTLAIFLSQTKPGQKWSVAWVTETLLQTTCRLPKVLKRRLLTA